MKKISVRVLLPKKLSKRAEHDTATLIKEMREKVKRDPGLIKKFKEYGASVDEIDSVPVCFCDLDVSAKTKDQKIYLNRLMLDDPDTDPTHYLIHELVHYLQQSRNCVDRSGSGEDYLDKPSEEESFKTQIKFKKREEGEDEAEEYVDGLLDHHELTGKKRTQKKKELLGN